MRRVVESEPMQKSQTRHSQPLTTRCTLQAQSSTQSITPHRYKWKWLKTIYWLWILWRKKSYTFEIHIDLQSQEIYADKRNFKESLHILEDSASNASKYIEHTIV